MGFSDSLIILFRIMAQVLPKVGAGAAQSWRRWCYQLAQVRKKGRDLRRLRTSIVDLRRKYQGEKLTCAKKWADLRQKEGAP